MLTRHRAARPSGRPPPAVAPISILGGTLAVYSSAIQRAHRRDGDAGGAAAALAPASLLYLVLLALNYAVMPRLSRRYVHPRTNKRSVALAEEVVKMGLGLGGWILTSHVAASNSHNTASGDAEASARAPLSTVAVLSRELEHWSPASTLLAAGLPSALYALQGTLTYTAYQNLDAVTFNGLTQLKVLSTALCCYVVLGKGQSAVQLLSLGLLMASAALFQGGGPGWWRAWRRRQRDGRGGCIAGDAATTENAGRGGRPFLSGVLPCLGATLLSGLAGALSQRSLQTSVGRMRRNAYFYTVEISCLSALCLLVSLGADAWRGSRTTSAEKGRGVPPTGGGDGDGPHGFFRHWTHATLLPVTTKAAAGLLTALVHRHLGSVVKGFALVLGLVFSALLQFALEGADVTGGQLAGTALVLLSSWLHFTHPATG